MPSRARSPYRRGDMAPEADPGTLVDVLVRRAALRPSDIAFRSLRNDLTEKETVTYGALDQRSRAVAGTLISRFAPGDRILLFAADPVDYIAGLFGAMYAGLTPISGVPPYSPRSGSSRHRARLDRLAVVLASSGARGIYGPSAQLEQVRQALENRLGVDLACVATETVGDRPPLTHLAPSSPDSIAFLQYTSGSTGPPGGVVLRHSNLISNLQAQCRGARMHEGDVGVSWLPLFHDFGLIGAAILPIYVGFPCVLMPAAGFLESPRRWLEAISRYGGTISWAPNFAYKLCVNAIEPPERDQLRLQSWRIAMNAAEPVLAQTVRDFSSGFAASGFRSTAMFPCYGLAEATLGVAAPEPGTDPRIVVTDRRQLAAGRYEPVEPGSPGSVDIVSCGQALPGVGVRIVDGSHLSAASEGDVGEIWLAGPGIAGGFFGEPERSQAAVGRLAGDPTPYLRTGDLGFMLGRDLFISGRLKDVLIIRGMNIYPQGLELTCLKSHSALRDDCACAFTTGGDAEDLLVIVSELAKGRHGEAEQAANAIRRAVFEEHGLSADVVVLIRMGSLPKTPSGKVQRASCRGAFLAGQLATVFESRVAASNDVGVAAMAGPLRPLDTATIRAWISRQLLAFAPAFDLRPDTHLADLGLSSLQVTELAAHIEAAFGWRIPVAELFEFRTISQIETRLLAGGDPSP